VVEAAKTLGAIELTKLREGLQGAQIMLSQARTAQTSLEVQREKLVTRMVDNIVPQLAEGVNQWVVIREKEHNRRAAQRLAAVTVTIAFGLVAGGYAFRSWQDTPATEALGLCFAKQFAASDGERFCALKYLLPQQE
jgi:hypothetical protein